MRGSQSTPAYRSPPVLLNILFLLLVKAKIESGIDLRISNAHLTLRWVRRSRSIEFDFFGEGCLSGASFRAMKFDTEAEGPPWGRARAKMVLVPFAKTKGTRLAGAKARIRKMLFSFPPSPDTCQQWPCHIVPDAEDRPRHCSHGPKMRDR